MANYFDIINNRFGNPYSSGGGGGSSGGNGGTPTHVESGYNLFELSIKVKGNSKVSIKETFSSLEIFEDIFSNSIHGFVEILDRDGGLEKFMITGGEELTITVLKPEPSTDILFTRQDLIVHQISKVDVNDQNSITYRLFFMPKSAINSSKKRIYRAYRNNLNVAELINKIYNEIEDTSNLGFLGENVALTKTFLSPGYTPFEAIDFLTKRASSIGRYHLFFERLGRVSGKKHVYGSLDKIRNYWIATGIIPVIFYNPQFNYITEENSSAIRASSIEYQSNFDHMSNMMSGFYNSRIRLINPIAKSVQNLELNYIGLANAGSTNPIIENTNIFASYNNSYPEYPGERMAISAINDPQANKLFWILQDTFGSINMNMIRINLDISGGSNDIGVGNLISLKVPSIHAKQLNYEGTYVADDMIYAGQYVVTAVRHILTYTSYTKKIEISKSGTNVNIQNAIASANTRGG